MHGWEWAMGELHIPVLRGDVAGNEIRSQRYNCQYRLYELYNINIMSCTANGPVSWSPNHVLSLCAKSPLLPGCHNETLSSTWITGGLKYSQH